jgi:hypothetical protein
MEDSMNGLWTAEFGSSLGVFGGGVVIFRDGQLLGGDGGYFYVGNYTLEGNTVRATFKASPFIAGYQSVFKTAHKDLILTIQGTLTDENHAVAQGSPEDMPNVKFGIKLTRRV